MGHSIEHQVSLGQCHFSQCSCGRGALKVKDKVILLSSAEVKEIGQLFSTLGTKTESMKTPLADKLNGLTGGQRWEEFTVPE